jgi:catechol 2,3-dioxygenase-like lactoylglutathione lyase family enzyme
MWISMTAELPVPDVALAQRYYRDVLGFKIGWLSEDQSYGAVYTETIELFMARRAEPRSPAVLCVRVTDVDAVYEQLRENEAQIVSELEQKPWAMREFSVQDPFGHCLRIGQSTLV